MILKSESQRLKELLEHTHGKELPECDLREILRGKSLEFYSCHSGHQVLQLVEHWRTRKDRPGKESKQLSLFEILEQDE
jgi:hypothetical protein